MRFPVSLRAVAPVAMPEQFPTSLVFKTHVYNQSENRISDAEWKYARVKVRARTFVELRLQLRVSPQELKGNADATESSCACA
eukprot:5276947-Pleurochrysis_carterae.AAC.1